MQAVVQTRYGSPEDLRLCEVAVPSTQDDQVLVRVRAASVHPDVWHMVTGRPFVLRLMGAGLTKPKTSIPGTDMAVFDVPGNHSLAECKRALKPDGRYVPIGHEAFGARGT